MKGWPDIKEAGLAPIDEKPYNLTSAIYAGIDERSTNRLLHGFAPVIAITLFHHIKH